MKMYESLHRHENQPITHCTEAHRQKHKNPHKHSPLIVTPHRNASITVCMAWREQGDRSHIGDGQQNAIPGSSALGPCVCHTYSSDNTPTHHIGEIATSQNIERTQNERENTPYTHKRACTSRAHAGFLYRLLPGEI